MVDYAILGSGVFGGGSSAPAVLPDTPIPPPIILADSLQEKDAKTPVEIFLKGGMSVYRVPEEHLRVWMAPFQDDQGNLHEASVIHTTLKPGYWKMDKRALDGVD
jgi:hypothetical protein